MEIDFFSPENVLLLGAEGVSVEVSGHRGSSPYRSTRCGGMGSKIYNGASSGRLWNE